MSEIKGDLKITRLLGLGNLTTAERDASTPATGDIIYNITTNQPEVYNGSWSGTGSAVNSVFGRIGAVTAQSGDYTAAQVTGALSDTLPDGKIWVGNGSNVATPVTPSGDVTITNTGVTAIGTNKVTDTMIRQSVGLSIIGRSANTTGDVTDITAGTDNQVMRRSGISIGFGAVNLASSNAVTGILPNANTTATSANTASAIVARNASGDVSLRNALVVNTVASGDVTAGGSVVAENALANRISMATGLGSPLNVGDLVNYNGGSIVLADAATGLVANAAYNSDAGGGSFVVDPFNTNADLNAVIGTTGTPLYLAAGGGQPTPNRVTEPGYLDQYIGYSWGSSSAMFFNPSPAQIVPSSLLLTSAPSSLYTTLYAGGYNGSATNVTQANDLGTNNLDAPKAGTGNITLSQMGNNVLGFDFGSSNADREFTIGAVNISNFISGNEFTLMAVIRPTSSNTGSIFGWETAFDTFYWDYNSTTNSSSGILFDTTFSSVTGTTPTQLNKTIVLTWTRDSLFSGKLYSNGVLIGTASQPESPDGTASVCQIGRSPSDGAFQGIMGVFAGWKRVLTSAEQTGIERQLMAQFGI